MQSTDVKLVMLGDTGVGKTSLLVRFILNKFRTDTVSNLGASFLSKQLEVEDRIYKLQIWDTAGQEQYQSLAPMYYRGANAAIIVYDITRQASFDRVAEFVRCSNVYIWIQVP
ncbi:small GTPase superfamily, Rho type [Kipferlia bialata]|uniref:Small GTPase superfamily, Rho type n=1 Tax=Kipferlia bialata TaxID=797122 RepID=A0A9K3D3I1_9EUKA|nr:small GTPase superfamily, Rho type [Kipferlia bialata]|eukprot:g8516.t1